MSYSNGFRKLNYLAIVTLISASGYAAQPAKTVPATALTSEVSPALLGPDDKVSIQVLGDDEIPDKIYQVDGEGALHLPLIGTLRASGRTPTQLETEIIEKLRPYLKDPKVTVNLIESHSRPVSVLGAVNNPGVHQITTPTRLLEMISLAGGVRQDAGTTVRITRRSEWGEIPLPTARKDLSEKFSVADLDLDSLVRGNAPGQNILILPQDVISVSKADVVFVLGEVKKAGGFPVLPHEKMSVLTAVALAEGMNASAAPKSARILRQIPDDSRRKQLPVDISSIMSGKTPDLLLEPNDIVVIPRNVARDIAIRSAEAAVQIATGLVIWRR